MNSLSCKATLQELAAFIVKFSVAVCTQPEAFNDVFVYAPLVEYVIPFAAHVYELHVVWDMEDIVLLSTIRFNVAVFMQPDGALDVKVYEPLDVYVCPFAAQTYESHALTTVFNVTAFSVNPSVAVSTHPTAFNVVLVYTPLIV